MATYLADMSKAKFYLADNRIAYEYSNGERTDKISGARFDVLISTTLREVERER